MARSEQVTQDAIRTALTAITEPDSGKDIVTAGMVSDIIVSEGNVGFAIEVDPNKGSALEPLRQEAEQAVQAIPGVLSVTAVLTAERSPGEAGGTSQAASGGSPLGGSGGATGSQRQRRSAGSNQQAASGHSGASGAGQRKIELPGVQAIVAVASGKGGVGKSTIAANLALAMHANGLRVGLLDADIYGPSIPRMMGVGTKPEMGENDLLVPNEAFGLKVMSIGFMVEEESPMIWRGPMVQSAVQQMLRDVAWGDLDCLVVDMPPGTGDAQLTLAQQVPLSGAVIVSTPQDLALTDARKGLHMFERVAVEVLGFVENMSYFVCPHCGEASEVFDHGGCRQEAERLGVPFLGELPLNMAIRETSDGGDPIVASQPDGPFALTFRDIADRVWQRVGDPAQRKTAPRIVVE